MASSCILFVGIAMVLTFCPAYSLVFNRYSNNWPLKDLEILEIDQQDELKERTSHYLSSSQNERLETVGSKFNTDVPLEWPVEVAESSEDPQLPESCKHSTYCENVLNYPEEAVRNYIHKVGRGNFEKDIPDIPEYTLRASFDDVIELCKSVKDKVYPQSGIGYDNKPHYLLNGKGEEEKLQGFNVQNCAEEGCDCDKVILQFQSGYRGRCMQFYDYRRARAFKLVNSTNVEEYVTYIKLNSHCACIAEPCTNDC